MKIIFLLTQDLSSPSGLGRYFPWAMELSRLGHEVKIIALHSNFTSLTERNATIEGVQVEYVAQMHVKKSETGKVYFSPWQLIRVALAGTIKLCLAALKTQADVVLIGKPHPMNTIAGWARKIFHPHTRIILDCDDLESGSNRFQAHWQKSIVAWFENLAPQKAQLVTSNTQYNLKRMERMGIPAEKLIYVPNGIDPRRFSAPEPGKVRELRTALGLTDRKVIAFIGSMSLTNHPVDLLLRAFPTVQKAVPEASLLLVGTGENMNEIKELARELDIEQGAIFAGRVSPEQVSLYYAISDVTVDPVYDNEAARGRCPLKMFESWACGVPFVTADVGDRKELAGDPPAAALVEAGNAESLADGLIRLLQNPSLAAELKQVASARVEEYSWAKIVERTHWIFSKSTLVKP